MKFAQTAVRCALLSSISIASISLASAAQAQDAGTETSETATAEEEVAFDEIIVTATRRDQAAQDIPLAVSVVAGEQLANAGVVDIRGDGLMIGIELDRPCAELVAIAREQGVLINVTADKVIRLVPPLIYGQAEADALIAAVASVVTLFLTQAA